MNWTISLGGICANNFIFVFTDVSQTPILNIIIIWFIFCTESVI